MVVNKDSFEASKAGLFTGASANKADVSSLLWAGTSKKKKHLVHLATQMAGKR